MNLKTNTEHIDACVGTAANLFRVWANSTGRTIVYGPTALDVL